MLARLSGNAIAALNSPLLVITSGSLYAVPLSAAANATLITYYTNGGASFAAVAAAAVSKRLGAAAGLPVGPQRRPCLVRARQQSAAAERRRHARVHQRVQHHGVSLRRAQRVAGRAVLRPAGHTSFGGNNPSQDEVVLVQLAVGSSYNGELTPGTAGELQALRTVASVSSPGLVQANACDSSPQVQAFLANGTDVLSSAAVLRPASAAARRAGHQQRANGVVHPGLARQRHHAYALDLLSLALSAVGNGSDVFSPSLTLSPDQSRLYLLGSAGMYTVPLSGPPGPPARLAARLSARAPAPRPHHPLRREQRSRHRPARHHRQHVKRCQHSVLSVLSPAPR